MKSILVVAPHPDDEVLGCGGTIKKAADNNEAVYILIVTKGSPKLYTDERIKIVRAEGLRAHRLLGVNDTLFLDYHAPELDLVSLSELSSSISQVITKHRVTQLYLPHHGDIHHDHRIVFKAGLVAARPVNGCTVKEVYSYETLSETEWSPPFASDAFVPNHFENITDQLDAKIKAMREYKSQLRDFPNPRSIDNIESLARYRGATVGFERAEAFTLIRSVRD